MASVPEDREISAEEKAAYAAQTESLNALTAIAQEQHEISQEQMDRYIEAYQDPASASSREALAEMQSAITGENVTADSLEGMGLEDIIRDTMMKAPAQFQREAENFISTTNELSEKYNAETAFNTKQATQALTDAGYTYQTELSEVKKDLGTIDKDILSRETGAATAGISTAFKEAQKGLQGEMARRGLTGSGADIAGTTGLASQEAMAKYSAMGQARNTSRVLSDQLRMQRMGIAGQQFNQAQQQAHGIYSLQQGAAQSIFQTGIGQAGNVMNTNTAATQQGIGTMLQAQGAAQGNFWQAGNMLGQAGQSYGAAASGYGNQAALQQQASLAEFQAQVDQALGTNEAIGSVIGTGAGAAIGKYSDKRLKKNIVKIGEVNSLNLYRWDWTTEAINMGIVNTPIGFIAQEVLEVMPEAVLINEDNGYYMVNYDLALGKQ